MFTAKRLGFKKGDLVLTGKTHGFPAIVTGNVNTFTPSVEAYGFEHEQGSAYANDLVLVCAEAWKNAVAELGHSFPLKAYHPASKAKLKEIGLQ